ncbi:MAG: AAA-like domain-containing protein [Cyanobacteria bacterium P01_F01_bin.150]
MELDFIEWWDGLSHVSVVKPFSLFLDRILLVQVQEPIVIVIDEIDSVLSLSFPCDDFFALLRSCHNRRTTHADYQRLTFVLVGVATPAEFISNKQRTPFNIGRSIDLQGFTFASTSPLLKGLQSYGSDAQTI